MNTKFGDGKNDEACRQNSPYCTRVESHWNKCSNNDPDYEQFWFFLKPENYIDCNGLLENDVVKEDLSLMKNKGYELLVGLTDTVDANNDRMDNELSGSYQNIPDANGINRAEEIRNEIIGKFIFIGKVFKKINQEYKCIKIVSKDQIPNLSLRQIPEDFEGSIDCSHSNLSSLEGSPRRIKGNFYCSNTMITSLIGGPEEVDGNFYCANTNISSLVGAPSKVGKIFSCSNTKIESLDGAPEKIGGIFGCSNTKITKEQLQKYKMHLKN